MDFGKRLREYRIKKGYSQHMVEDILGLKKSALSTYERKKQVPPLDKLIKFADLFDVSIDILCREDENLSEVQHAVPPGPKEISEMITGEEKDRLLECSESASGEEKLFGEEKLSGEDRNRFYFAGFCLKEEQIEIIKTAQRDSEICGFNHTPEEIFQMAMQLMPPDNITRLLRAEERTRLREKSDRRKHKRG